SSQAKMNRTLEQRYAVKFCVRLGKTATETYTMIKDAFGNNSMGRSSIFEWHKLFKEGREQVENDHRSGRPSTSRSDQNVRKVKEILDTDRRLTIRLIAEELEVLERLRKRVLRVRPAMASTWKLHHDNAPCHTALLVQEWQAKHNLLTLPHPPYSPDLAPPDFFLFPRLKRQMKGRRFDTIETVQEAVTRGLRSIPVENFQQAYANWQTRYTKCINSGGCYFEEY
ncbi:Putative uncharacterized protein FLJ37770, partial [Habropoda laboriosa]